MARLPWQLEQVDLTGNSGGGGNNAPGGGGGVGHGLPTKTNPQNADLPSNFSHTLVFATTGVPQVFPGFRVPPGSIVRVRANGGTATGNVAVCYVGKSISELINNGGLPLAPLDDQNYPIQNLGTLWAKGTAGDGVTVSVTTFSA